jgi:glycosyltransferase involved in cell wall biosynthesis
MRSWRGVSQIRRFGDRRSCVRVSVVIPTRNEAQAIGRVLADIPRELVNEIIVVDSCSSDGTPEIAARMDARVITESRRGYGQACLTGIANANAADVVVFLDGDYSDRPAELPLLLAPIVEEHADLTIGSRTASASETGALQWHSAFGNWLAANLINALYGLKITDLGPFRAVRASVLREIELRETTYGWAVELILKSAIHGLRIVEVPVSYHPRIGKSKITGTLKGSIGAGWYILSRILLSSFRRGSNRMPKSG